MTTITVTRHFSGFADVADSFELGNAEHEGSTELGRYLLPDGYTLDSVYGVVRDAAGYQCGIYADNAGHPTLISLAGPNTATPRLVEAR